MRHNGWDFKWRRIKFWASRCSHLGHFFYSAQSAHPKPKPDPHWHYKCPFPYSNTERFRVFFAFWAHRLRGRIPKSSGSSSRVGVVPRFCCPLIGFAGGRAVLASQNKSSCKTLFVWFQQTPLCPANWGCTWDVVLLFLSVPPEFYLEPKSRDFSELFLRTGIFLQQEKALLHVGSCISHLSSPSRPACVFTSIKAGHWPWECCIFFGL